MPAPSRPASEGRDYKKGATEGTLKELVAGGAAGVGTSADAAATTDTGTFSLISLFKRLLAKFTAGAAVALVKFNTTATFARPNDTNAYLAKDTVTNSTSAPAVMQFAAMALAVGGGGTINKARLAVDNKAMTARFRLHLFSVSSVSIPNDNAPYLLLYTNVAKRIGAIDFNALATEDPTNSTMAVSLRDDLSLDYMCDAADTKLYGVLEALDAFTPVAQTNFHVFLEGYKSAAG